MSYQTNDKIAKMHNIASANSVKCKCGHSVFITNKYKRVICNWCNRYVYASEEDRKKYEEQEFIYRMKGLLKNDKK